jgi:NTP pyrophosphatase (non-canonical NTP hydrolase)
VLVVPKHAEETRRREVMDLTQLQEEMKPWVLANFGERPASQPLRGIFEEIGELQEACEEDDDEKVEDAVADCIIFMADYCNSRGYSMERIELTRTGKWVYPRYGSASQMLKVLGKLAHHDLKKEQGIRVTEDHDAIIQQYLGHILDFLCAVLDARGVSEYIGIVEKTWNKVKQRDWKKNPAKGVA